MKVLFIDDDDIRTKPLRQGLALLGGYSVNFVLTPQDAVKIFEDDSNPIDAVIVDIMMPHYDINDFRDFSIPGKFSNNQDGMYTGLQLICIFQQIMKTRNRKTPIIILTCIDEIDEYLKSLLSDGRLLYMPDAVFIKPIFLAEFVTEVDNAITSHSRV